VDSQPTSLSDAFGPVATLLPTFTSMVQAA
jgi:hypothetical protein